MINQSGYIEIFKEKIMAAPKETENNLRAVTQDGMTLEHILEQTPEICLAAVRE
jgi:hypothetical protein